MAIRFLLNGLPVTLERCAPTATVLDWLREERHLRGTKEGCAEGDCGACTVLVGDLDGSRIAWRPVNACILFLPVLDGKALLTVEGLGGSHPVQRAMVEHHGSQCGFCTPGFVMALAAHAAATAAPSRPDVQDAISGNLCRCTGYRPIVDAALAAGHAPLHADEPAWAERLATIQRDNDLVVEDGTGRFIAPCDAKGVAHALAAHPDATLLAGGTDVGLWVTKQHKALPTVVSLNAAPDLGRVEDDGTALVIGAAVRLVDAHRAIVRDWPELDELFRRYGGTQVRSAGTLVGNVANASPIGDGSPALLALGAEAVVRDTSGTTTIPLDRFFLGYRKTALPKSAFIEAIRIPHRLPGTTLRAWKVSRRVEQDISAVCAVIAIRENAGRIVESRLAFGGMAAVPARAPKAEAALVGRAFDAASVEAAVTALSADFTPIDDLRASARYRLEVAGNLLRRLLHERHGASVRLADLEPVDA